MWSNIKNFYKKHPENTLQYSIKNKEVINNNTDKGKRKKILIKIKIIVLLEIEF